LFISPVRQIPKRKNVVAADHFPRNEQVTQSIIFALVTALPMRRVAIADDQQP
jgi:hypothetical protein